MKKIITALLLFSSVGAFAQTAAPRKFADSFNSWWMYFGSHKFSAKWGLHLEGQVRRNSGLEKSQQLLFRTGFNYHFNPAAFATAGYCFVETYPYGEFASKSAFPEHRLWEQIQLKHVLGPFEVVSRFRLEQRFVKSPVAQGAEFVPGPAVYTNRFRVFNRVSVPFKGKTIAEKSWYLTAYEELFVSFGKNVALNLFDQNRAYVAIGYRLPKAGRLELGYMNQLIIKGDGVRVENNHTLMASLSSTIDFKANKP